MATELPEVISKLYPFTPKTLEVVGGRMSYVDEGQGEAVLMLHGNPTWSFFYRNLINGLKHRYRCIAPDHIGMGLSDKPGQGFDYRLASHIDNVARLVKEIGLERFHLVVHDWGGAIGMGLAERFPERVGKLVVMNTAAFRATRIPGRIALCRTPLLGELYVRGLNGFAGPATWMATNRPLDLAAKAGYLYPYRDWASRIATHRFVKDIPMKPSHPSYDTLKGIEEGLEALQSKAMLLLWGMKDFCFDVTFLREWQKRFPAAKTVELHDAGHYLLEDRRDTCLINIENFLDDPEQETVPKKKPAKPKPPK